MTNLRISLIQTSIVWENIEENLCRYEEKIMPLAGKTDLVVFPEMFTTGFTMHSRAMAEPNGGLTMRTVKRWAKVGKFAVTGSFIARDGNKYYNRGFFVLPCQTVYFYDKRHLFSLGGEDKHFSPGNERLVVSFNGWNISLLICYDLRFPVWARNVDCSYDLLIVPANWPASRKVVFQTLLMARAMENSCFVCGVNRVGTDGENLTYCGNSALIDPRGRQLSNMTENADEIETVTLRKDDLECYRQKFPVWKDADSFSIERSAIHIHNKSQ
ncbi:MAG: nitrilase family protein [Bacteroidales bacterium]|jgi:predicted amidohydrolase|nr:nitrilase family protein [Bacteroidales bacterium]